MDNDLNGFMSDVEDLNYVQNGVDSMMTNFQEGNNSIKEDSNQLEKKVSENDSCSSESDALVIDEGFPKNQKKLKKVNTKHHTVVEEENVDNTFETLTHSNPFFNKSLFELSQLHQNYQKVDFKDCMDDTVSKYKRGKNKPKGRLQEYAQYLGLQPAIQFKCSKCSRAGFETLTALQEHVSDCNEKNVQEITGNLSSGFKLTRKVFLCSACGTYYENWNLYMHMLEIHQRFICLYCLGMFSLLEDLCQHLQSKHNLQPGYKNSPDDFFNTYNEPCYLVCCECHKLFNEQDNFFYHNCNKNSVKKKMVKTQIAPENHVTGETEAIANIFPDLDKVVEENKSCVDNKNGIKFQETMETNNENLVSNKHISQDSNVNESIKDNVENHFEENGSLGDVIGHPEDNLNIEPSYTDSKLELTTDETNCETDFSKKISDKEEDMQEPEEISQQTQSAFDKQLETRKVPKLSLKLPKPGMYTESADDSDDSEKLMMDQVESDYDIEHENSKDRLGHITSDNENLEEHEEEYEEENEELKDEVENEFFKSYNEEKKSTDNNKYKFQVAGVDVPVVELVLEQPLDKFDPHVLLQKCLKNTIQSCIYCNHARKIAVNGKQLALHCIAEHRFSAVVNSITAEELIPESFVNCLSESLDELSKSFFSLDSNFSNEAVTFSHLFECFQCYFSTTIHKELYLHNRKFHSKNLLLCIMCKSNFFSYSELICHLCPGVYVLDYDLQFRCCMCVNEDLPSSFRLMVHLRKKHNVCDVCLEMCHTQYRLSNHVWKHKLHHFCYRCGIAYRNKPDITRHLFWKHGTESVLCKKCLQKKWPHVYHFCVPPSSFTCDECGLNVTKAVSLKVHKRIHTNDKKHQCSVEGCLEKFVSNKLKMKHEQIHYEPPKDLKTEEKVEDVEEKTNGKVDLENDEHAKEVSEEKPKAKIDVLDLPALNLSESDSSDSENENLNKIPEQTVINKESVQSLESNTGNDISLSNSEADIGNQEEQEQAYTDSIKACEEEGKQSKVDVLDEPDDIDHSNTVIQNIWDNFKNYQASKGKLDNLFIETERTEDPSVEETTETEITQDVFTVEDALRDHDYCLVPEQTTDTTLIEVKPALTESVDHDYCSPKLESVSEKIGLNIENAEVEDVNNVKIDCNETQNKSQVNSSSSSDSDSSSCSCGSNCSCSSSSGSSSSSSNSSGSDSSTEEGRKRQQAARKQRRKDRAKKMKEIDKTATSEVIAMPKLSSVHLPVSADTPIQESDLETVESETDEEFYDKAPQKMANKILEEKRQQLLSIMGPNNVPNGSFIESTSRPPTPPAGEIVEEEERKKKKSKSKKRKKHRNEKKEVTVPVSSLDVPIPPYYQQFHQTFNQPQSEPPPPESPTNVSVPTNFSVVSPSLPVTSYPKVQLEPLAAKQESSDTTLRASKRRRVPNKFYGYSSDEDQEKSHVAKWKKTESVTPRSPLIVPPITIKTTSHATPPPPPPQVVEPISIRTGTHLSEFRVQRPRPRPSSIPPIKLLSGTKNDDSASDSNDSSSEDHNNLPPKPAQPQLYCYCRCPYDEVSEMIGCDASDCAIEWFHFECVGIMVPPKGQWFCPDCRKKKQQKRDFFSSLAKSST